MKLKTRIFTFLFVLLSALPLLSQADEKPYHKLFREDTSGLVYNSNYRSIIQNLKAGDVIELSNNQKYTVKKILGFGGTTLVFSIEEMPGLALRIPLFKETAMFIDMYAAGARQLRKEKVPSVRVVDYLPSEALIVEEIPGKFITFETFIDYYSPSPMQKVKRQYLKDFLDTKPLLEALDRFAEHTSHISNVGDLHAANLVFSFESKKWILMDWTSYVDRAETTRFDFKTIFDFAFEGYGEVDDGKFTPRDPQFEPLIELYNHLFNKIQFARKVSQSGSKKSSLQNQNTESQKTKELKVQSMQKTNGTRLQCRSVLLN